MARSEITGPVVFDSEGLSRAVRRDPFIRVVILSAYLANEPVVISAVTLVEAIHPGIDRSALAWVRSRLRVVPTTEAIAISASEMLAAAKLHGHRHAIDAIVASTSLTLGGNPTIFTSDSDDFESLVGGKVRIVPLT